MSNDKFLPKGAYWQINGQSPMSNNSGLLAILKFGINLTFDILAFVISKIDRLKIPVCGLNRGVTLVEVLLAVVVLSVGLAGVLRAYAASIGALEVSRETVITIELLKEKTADVEQKMIEQGGISAGSASGRFDGKFADYNWAWGTATTAQEGLYELTMSVARADGARQVSLITYAQNKDYEPQE